MDASSGFWATYVASDELLEQFEVGRFMPEPRKVIKQLKHCGDGSYADTLQRTCDQGWRPLSSYVHGGPLQVSRRHAKDLVGPKYADGEISELLAFSNAMALIAAMEIPSLTNDRAFAHEMMKIMLKRVDSTPAAQTRR